MSKAGVGPLGPPPLSLRPLLAACHGLALLGAQPVGDALDAVLLAASGFALVGGGRMGVCALDDPSQVGGICALLHATATAVVSVLLLC